MCDVDPTVTGAVCGLLNQTCNEILDQRGSDPGEWWDDQIQAEAADDAGVERPLGNLLNFTAQRQQRAQAFKGFGFCKVGNRGLADGVVSFFDHERRLRTEPVDRYVLIRVRGAGGREIEGGGRGGLLVLVDGQRFVGSWLGGSQEGDGIVWTHPALGMVCKASRSEAIFEATPEQR